MPFTQREIDDSAEALCRANGASMKDLGVSAPRIGRDLKPLRPLRDMVLDTVASALAIGALGAVVAMVLWASQP